MKQLNRNGKKTNKSKRFLQSVLIAVFIVSLGIFCGCSSVEEMQIDDTNETIVDGKENVDKEDENKEDENKEDENKVDDNNQIQDAESDLAKVQETEKEETDSEPSQQEDSSPKLTFETQDLDGNIVHMDDYKDAKVVMLNFWEPWCGPCVEEMPELQKLYENYKDSGLVILGVFSTQGEDESVRAVIDECNINYPILRAQNEMYPYMTEYVPTTVFLDGNGRLLQSEPVVGANQYNDWEKMVKELLNE